MQFAGDFNVWTINRNHGDTFTAGLHGKKVLFYGEPQVWYNITNHFSAGSKINLYYHVLNEGNVVQVYPTVAAMYHF